MIESPESQRKDYQTRHCKLCGKLLKGRPDKKFCNDTCRNDYNNDRHEFTPLMTQINKILRRNRYILKQALGSGAMITLDKTVLNEMDFNFYYHTHYRKDKNGNTIYFCYEYAFRPLKNASVVICKGYVE